MTKPPPYRTDRTPASKQGAPDVENRASQGGSVSAFLKTAKAVQAAGPRPALKSRLVFGIDATMSREHSWDVATGVQGAMFEAAAEAGGLDVQLVFFRGFRECKSSAWHDDGRALATTMAKVGCRAGNTQVCRVLSHALKEAGRGPVRALVYVGDAFEEDPDRAGHLAGQLGVLRVPVFCFHEGRHPAPRR
ncbi:MAG: VWA domain-containing protein, partial [Pseudomonadota bacterium]